MNIPWKLKSTAFRVLSHLPGGALYFVQRYVTRRSVVRIGEVYRGWLYHEEIVKKTGAKTLIEFGAGKTLAQNLYLSQFLDSQVVVDLFPMLDFDQLNQAAVQLKGLGVPIKAEPINTLDELQREYGITYVSPFDMRSTDFDAGSFDICVSTNTLEHIPRADIEAIVTELFRILAPGGTVSAMIDYSDHYAHSDRSLNRLNYLQFDETKWQKFNHSNHYQNRMRHGHYREIFIKSGFTVLAEDPTDYSDPTGLTLRNELLTGSDDDNSTTGFWHLTKPSE